MQNSIYQPPNTAPSGLPANSNSYPTDSTHLVEFQRLKDKDAFEELTDILKKAGIAYKAGSNAPIFDLSTIGMERDVDVIISVKIEDYPKAQEAAEAYYLDSELPDNHYLLSSTDNELFEVINSPMDWSPFDVSHPKTLAAQRGLDPNTTLHMAKPRQQYPEQRSYGKILLIAIAIMTLIACLLAAALNGGLV